jgi:hypothetical protein
MGVTMLDAAPLCPFSGTAATKPSKCGYRVILPGCSFYARREIRFCFCFCRVKFLLKFFMPGNVGVGSRPGHARQVSAADTGDTQTDPFQKLGLRSRIKNERAAHSPFLPQIHSIPIPLKKG